MYKLETSCNNFYCCKCSAAAAAAADDDDGDDDDDDDDDCDYDYRCSQNFCCGMHSGVWCHFS